MPRWVCTDVGRLRGKVECVPCIDLLLSDRSSNQKTLPGGLKGSVECSEELESVLCEDLCLSLFGFLGKDLYACDHCCYEGQRGEKRCVEIAWWLEYKYFNGTPRTPNIDMTFRLVQLEMLCIHVPRRRQLIKQGLLIGHLSVCGSLAHRRHSTSTALTESRTHGSIRKKVFRKYSVPEASSQSGIHSQKTRQI